VTLIEKREAYNPDKTYYTCPMTTHSYVISEEPGNCPVCGMTLKEK
jgi:rubrerythrin